MSVNQFVVGLDAGGSKTLLRGECTEHSEQIERRGPGANPNRIGLDEAAGVLIDLVEASRRECSSDLLSICAGVSGAGRGEEQEALRDALHSSLSTPDRTVYVEVVHDALIALDAAYDTGSGIVVIAGTGSVVLGRTIEGRCHRVGGWGHRIGDPGSGYSVGQAGLRAVAASFEGGEGTTIQPRLRSRHGIESLDQLIHTVYRDEVAMQSVAPLVVEAAADGDPVATRILMEETDDLIEQIGWVVARSESISPQITLLGGMVQNAHYEEVLHRRLADQFPNWSVQQLRAEPVTGALRRAHRLRSPDAECSA